MFASAAAAPVVAYHGIKHKVKDHNHRPEAFNNIMREIEIDKNALRVRGKIHSVALIDEVLNIAKAKYAEVKTNGDLWDCMEAFKQVRKMSFDLASK